MNYSILQFLYAFSQDYPMLGRFFVFISGPVSYIIVPFLILVYVSHKTKENFMYAFSLVFLSGFTSFLSARILKEIFRVARPGLTHDTIIPLSTVGGYSFPSEHASVYGALTVALFHFDYRLGIASLVFGILVMLSRVIIGVHYPFDVVVGFAVGALCAYGCVLFFKRFI